jgi:CRP-like cAMP-binding protein
VALRFPAAKPASVHNVTKVADELTIRLLRDTQKKYNHPCWRGPFADHPVVIHSILRRQGDLYWSATRPGMYRMKGDELTKEIEPRAPPPTGGGPFSPAAFLETAAQGRTINEYRKGETIFSQGDEADSVVYIKQGRIKVTVVSTQGKEAVVAILGPDEFLGEGCLIGQPRRLATAAAMTDCVVMRVDKTEIMRVLRDEPTFSRIFISHILTRNARVEEDLVDQMFNSTEKRLARVLLLLANFGKEGKPEPIIAKISQETLAEMIGTTRSRVSFFMNKFRSLGFIEYNGHLEVHSSLLSVVLNDQPNTVETSP